MLPRRGDGDVPSKDNFGDARRNLLAGNGGDDNSRGRADTAIGAKGVDRCEAETETSCER